MTKAKIILIFLFCTLQGYGQSERMQLTIKYGRATNYTLDFLNRYPLANFDNEILFNSNLKHDSVDFYILKFEGMQRSKGDTLILNPTTAATCWVFPIIYNNGNTDTLGLSRLKLESFYYPMFMVNGVELIKNDTIILDRTEEYRYYSIQKADYPLDMTWRINQLIVRIGGETKILDSDRFLKNYSAEINAAGGFEVLYMEFKMNERAVENYILDSYVKIN